MKKNKFYSVSELWQDMPKYGSLHRMNDTICVILGASFVDRCLANAIVTYMPIKDKIFIKEELLNANGGVLDTFSSRNKIVYAMKIIDKQFYQDISIIGKIRNHFAHHHIELSFNDPEVISLCNKLTLWENCFPPEFVNDYKKAPKNIDPNSCKEKFINSVTEVVNKFIGLGSVHKILHKEET